MDIVYPIEIEYGDFGTYKMQSVEYCHFKLNKLQGLLTRMFWEMQEVANLSITMSEQPLHSVKEKPRWNS